MRKIITALLLIALSVGACAVCSAAFMGTAAEVVAGDISLIKTGLLGKKLVFSDADFKSALCLSNFESITVTKLPKSTEGTLLLGGRRLSEGKTVARKNIASLVFIPASTEVKEASFSFTVEGYCGGAEIVCTMKFIDKINYAPDAGDEKAAAIKTQASIGAHGRMSGSDPEGDALEFMIISYPKKGILSISGEDGASYVYTPKAGYTGADSFTYVVRDEYGNYSSPCSVKINVIERMCATEYTDMVGKDAYNAAVAMSAMGVMGGKIVGDDMYFMPDTEVSKAEFLAMAMKASGIRKDTTLTSSFFDDDADIPPSLVGYVATAQRTGIVNGDFDNGRLLFNPNAKITKYEAAKIMAEILGASADGEESVFNSADDSPAWARSSVSAMITLGIFNEERDGVTTACVTRADCANYLYKLCERTK